MNALTEQWGGNRESMYSESTVSPTFDLGFVVCLVFFY